MTHAEKKDTLLFYCLAKNGKKIFLKKLSKKLDIPKLEVIKLIKEIENYNSNLKDIWTYVALTNTDGDCFSLSSTVSTEKFLMEGGFSKIEKDQLSSKNIIDERNTTEFRVARSSIAVNQSTIKANNSTINNNEFNKKYTKFNVILAIINIVMAIIFGYLTHKAGIL